MISSSVEVPPSLSSQNRRLKSNLRTAGHPTQQWRPNIQSSAKDACQSSDGRWLGPTSKSTSSSQKTRTHPMGGPNVHGIYYSIPATTTAVSPREFEVVHEEETKKVLRSGFRYGKNRRSSVYIPPRPPVGHGPHRYFFELVALMEPLDPTGLSPLPTKEELSEVINGKVAGWGLWIGIFENKWE
jgi:phosphatidylethanolamine-binding protein (PEBP) family uncharacterized protein